VREPIALLVAAIATAAALAGCGGGDTTTDTATAQKRAAPQAAPPERVEPSTCPYSVHECRSAQGRIAYVERVDPDGDGDAHFVIVDAKGITLPGLTAIDVRRGLRPHPLPGPGELISAAGPVQTGSYGQSQIHAIEIHVAGRGG
jgi:hypothetical protein